VVADFALTGSMGRYHRYTGVLRPWFWLLTRSQNCRVFQNKTVPEIALQIFGEHGFSDHQDRLHTKYPPREYCVQYRESDFGRPDRG
jgi:type VI secretion system secreted protein VgrG